MSERLHEAPKGLEGLVVAETRIGDVRGEEGFFHYRGYDATELARDRTLEEVWHLLVFGSLPDPGERRRFVERLDDLRSRLPVRLLEDLRREAAASPARDRMATLRSAWSRAAEALGTRPWGDLEPEARLEQALALSAVGPLLVAATQRPAVGPAVDTLPGSTAAAYLELVLGAPASPAQVQALERYLVLTIDHGLNASTFTARTVASTGADLGAVLVAALSALSGPLHGGAPSRALEMLDEIGSEDRAEGWVREALARGERIMGFGHRVYRTEDPRAALLRATAQELGGSRIELALRVEEVVKQVLAETKPGRALDVNVEYYAALVLDAVGLPAMLFTPTFAISRSIGWMAHALEQMQGNRIVRPSARYVGIPPVRPLAPSTAPVSLTP